VGPLSFENFYCGERHCLNLARSTRVASRGHLQAARCGKTSPRPGLADCSGSRTPFGKLFAAWSLVERHHDRRCDGRVLRCSTTPWQGAHRRVAWAIPGVRIFVRNSWKSAGVVEHRIAGATVQGRPTNRVTSDHASQPVSSIWLSCQVLGLVMVVLSYC
jgi:hypothetical protein